MTSAPRRLTALDMLRGLAVAGMIVVNSPGDGAQVYCQLDHAAWHGATLADMVFPAFLYSVGVALGWSFPRALNTPAERRRYWMRLARRAAALILLGLAIGTVAVIERRAIGQLSATESWLTELRGPGVLQRIGLCYGLAGALVFVTARRNADGLARIGAGRIAAVTAAVLIGYWLLLALVPVPGFGAGDWTPAGNLPGYIDRLVFTQAHIWRFGSATGTGPPTYDPEGLLSTLPATGNVLLGVLTACVWKHAPTDAPRRIAIVGIALIALGLSLHPVFPLNKRLWTSSFALLSSGVSALALAMLEVTLRSALAERALIPLRVLGGNAILAFLLSTLLGLMAVVPIGRQGAQAITMQSWCYHVATTLVPDPRIASLLCAVAVLIFVTLLIWPLHRRAVHFRL